MVDLSQNNRAVPSYVNELLDDCRFTPEGEAVFLSEEADNGDIVASSEATPATVASRILEDGTKISAKIAGGIKTTNLENPELESTVMGLSSEAGPSEPMPFKQAPQKENHIGFVAPANGRKKKSKKGRRPEHKSKEKKESGPEQKDKLKERRDREHSKRSKARKKFLLESLQKSVQLLREENEKLKESIKTHLGEETANKLLAAREDLIMKDDAPPGTSTNLVDEKKDIMAKFGGANKSLDDTDNDFIKALQTAQQNFCVTDPALPDNPIVYATQGFLNLTGYTLDQVLGRNCRFLQGPETDPVAVDQIRKAIAVGNDMSTVLLNYRADGSTFWNQFFIAALRDANDNITNYVGVQCKVSDEYAATVCKKQIEMEEEEDPIDQEGDDNEDGTGEQDQAEKSDEVVIKEDKDTDVKPVDNTKEENVEDIDAKPIDNTKEENVEVDLETKAVINDEKEKAQSEEPAVKDDNNNKVMEVVKETPQDVKDMKDEPKDEKEGRFSTFWKKFNFIFKRP